MQKFQQDFALAADTGVPPLNFCRTTPMGQSLAGVRKPVFLEFLFDHRKVKLNIFCN